MCACSGDGPLGSIEGDFCDCACGKMAGGSERARIDEIVVVQDAFLCRYK